MKPILNIASEKILYSIVKCMPQSLLIHGPVGVGLITICKYIAELRNIKPMIILPEKNEVIDLVDGSISVKSIRDIYDLTRTKTKNEQIIIIDYAERMTNQAQNAFLKLLEEPGLGINFILATHSMQNLLPTILSRLEKFELKPISLNQSKDLLKKLGVFDKIKISQLMFMASGLPAELTRLSNNEEYFNSRSQIVRNARELLTGSLYQKLLISYNYKDSRSGVLLLLDDVLKILNQSISQNPQIVTINRIESILNTYKQIEANGNIRLCLARMVL